MMTNVQQLVFVTWFWFSKSINGYVWFRLETEAVEPLPNISGSLEYDFKADLNYLKLCWIFVDDAAHALHYPHIEQTPTAASGRTAQRASSNQRLALQDSQRHALQ